MLFQHCRLLWQDEFLLSQRVFEVQQNRARGKILVCNANILSWVLEKSWVGFREIHRRFVVNLWLVWVVNNGWGLWEYIRWDGDLCCQLLTYSYTFEDDIWDIYIRLHDSNYSLYITSPDIKSPSLWINCSLTCTLAHIFPACH